MYINNSFVTFFKGLIENNNKEWFDANRKIYENEVKKPFAIMVDDAIKALQRINPDIQILAKDAIFRINRDIRFSADKTPYKTHVSAAIAKGGKKDMVNPGIYFELTPENFTIYSGVYMPDKTQLEDIRAHIFRNAERFKQLITNEEFLSICDGGIHGEKQKRIDKDYDALSDEIPVIRNKQFYYFKKHPIEEAINGKPIEKIIAFYQAALPLNLFFYEALHQ
jgi:uncharacterized protein (TIGR02453 family)